jgi:ParB-like nuclease domain
MDPRTIVAITGRVVSLPITISDIDIPDGRRDIVAASVKNLADSIDKVGLRHPITVLKQGERYVLVAGLHRIEAHKKLGLDHIPATIVAMTESEAQLWEIAENLHRAELTVQERSDQIARWVELIEQKNKPAQLGRVSPKGGRGQEGGDSQASRDLGISRQKVQRAKKIASIDPAAKVAAKEAGLDDHQSALLQLADVPAEEQVEWVDAAKLHAEADDLERKARVQHQIAEDFAAGTGLLQPIESKRAAKISEKKYQVAARGTETRKFAAWIIARSKPGDIAKVANWLESLKAAEVIAAIRGMQQ